MGRHLVVFIEPDPSSLLAASWAVTTCGTEDTIELVAPWRGRQLELDPATGHLVDGQTAARLRLLSALDRVRAVVPDARLTLELRAGSPLDLLPEATRGKDLLVLGGRSPRRLFPDRSVGRRPSLLRLAECPTVVVRPMPGGSPEAVLTTALGARQRVDQWSLDALLAPGVPHAAPSE